MFLLKPFFKNIGKAFSNKEVYQKLLLEGSELSEESLISYFNFTGTKTRFLNDENEDLAQLGAKAVESVCQLNRLDVNEIDLIIYAGMSKQYYEPTTAALIAHQLGLKNVACYDVTAACAGMSLGLQSAFQQLSLDNELKKVVVVSVELPYEGINWQIASEEELINKGAGLTLSASSSALILSKVPKEDCFQILEFVNHYDNSYAAICQAPIKSSFFSDSSKLIRPSLVAIKKLQDALLKKFGERYSETIIIPHQPATQPIETMAKILKLPFSQVLSVHQKYANSISGAWVSAYSDLIEKENKLLYNNRPLAVFTAAGGFCSINFIGKFLKQDHEG